ncbi:MAG: response regulator transcription factor [Candidatus Eremiobacteraeota bacterium]|nr:response regulator transcription factor [Candidatus Eremiobacteraeota bacterium]
MARLRTVIVDDEALARERIRTLLAGWDDIDLVAECASGREAVAAVRKLRPALLFLDIQMPELDGFGVLQALPAPYRPEAIVFVTAHDRFAVHAFDVNAIDYLLKPYTAERFNAALERARARLGDRTRRAEIDKLLESVAARTAVPERLTIRSRNGVQFVPVHDVDWLEADRNYTVLHLGTQALRIRETISELEDRLGAAGFVRVHRSVIVNADRIFRLEPWAHGEYVIVLRNGTKVISGRGYGERVRSLFA